MLLVERESGILAYINERGVAKVRELADLFNVTEVTIRRDLKRLEDLELIQRTHGGAVSIGYQNDLSSRISLPDTPVLTEEKTADALIITPIQNRAAHTLHERAVRNQIPLIAESVPQEGAIYLGCDNYQGGYELGRWSGEYFLIHHASTKPSVLDITLHRLPNTRERSTGFKDGIRSVLGDDVEVVSVDGRGFYSDAYQIISDALRLHPQVNILFGINDDSILGGMQAYIDLGFDPEALIAVGMGGEGNTVLDALVRDTPLKACLGMFPNVVGQLAVSAIGHLWAGGNIENDIITPTTIITPANIADYYTQTEGEWVFIPGSVDHLVPYPWVHDEVFADGKHISFLILYRTHEWYQNEAKAMEQRAREIGASFSVTDIRDDVRAETRELRRLIGKLAASYVEDGDKIILDSGTTTSYMAHYLRGCKDLTVVTNSYDVFQQLYQNPEIKLILTGGDFDRASQSFVGRNAHLLLKEIRVDKAFIVAGGVSSSFGISSVNEAEAEVRRSMIQAAREVILLADHTVLGLDSNVRVSGLHTIDTIITDAGVLAEHRLELSQVGIQILVAGGFQADGQPVRVHASQSTAGG